jgi:enamine deaminase RidA (YjgF/YER057c/UK114 family)
VFMTDLKNFAAFDEVWKEFFKVPPPRKTVSLWIIGILYLVVVIAAIRWLT